MINKILELELNNYFWLYFLKKILRLNKIYFILSNKKYLPYNNHPLDDSDNFLEEQYNKFNNNKFNFNKDLFKNLKKIFRYNSNLKVLDIGGENLDLYLFLKKKFPKIKIYVVNQSKLIKSFKKLINKKNIKGINVFSNVKDINNINFDFVYFGSSLQYIKFYDKILVYLLKKKINYFCISATSYFYSGSSNKKIILKQLNLLPQKLYCYCFNFNHIESFFKKFNYKKIFKKQNPYKKINFQNFKMKIEYLNVLYKRIK